MAERMAGMLIDETTGIGTVEKHGRGPGRRIGGYGVAAAVLLAMLIVGTTLHNRRETDPVAITTDHPNKAERLYTTAPALSASVPAISQASDGQWLVTQVRDDGTVQTAYTGARSPAVVTRTQQRFLENNTTNLPEAVAAEIYPVVTSEQQRFLEVNTDWFPTIGANAAVRDAGVVVPAGANVTSVCHFTYSDAYMCSRFRPSGTWLRDESADNGNWSLTAQAAPREDMNVNRVCHFTYSDAYLCAVFQTDGTWLRDEMMDNGYWNVIAQAVPVNEVRLP